MRVKKGEMLQFQRAWRQSQRAVSMAVLWKPGSAAHSFQSRISMLCIAWALKKPAGVLYELGLYCRDLIVTYHPGLL